MIIPMMFLCVIRMSDQMQRHTRPETEPRMTTDLEGFLNGFQKHDILIEFSHLRQVFYINSQMVEDRSDFFLRLSGVHDCSHKKRQIHYSERCFHSGC